MVKKDIVNISPDLKNLVGSISSDKTKEINLRNLQDVSFGNLEQMQSLSAIVSKLYNFERNKEIAKEDENRIVSLQSIDSLFIGSIESPLSKLRKDIFESDFVEAIIALPNQMFSNVCGLYCLFILNCFKSNNKKGKIQLIDATCCYEECEKDDKKYKKFGLIQINEIVKALNEYQTKKYEFYNSILRSKVCNLNDFFIYEIEIFKDVNKRTDDNFEKLLIKTSLTLEEYFEKYLKQDYSGFKVDKEKIVKSYEILFFDAFV